MTKIRFEKPPHFSSKHVRTKNSRGDEWSPGITSGCAAAPVSSLGWFDGSARLAEQAKRSERRLRPSLTQHWIWYISMYIYIYIHRSVYIYTYIHTYIHTDCVYIYSVYRSKNTWYAVNSWDWMSWNIMMGLNGYFGYDSTRGDSPRNTWVETNRTSAD